MISKRLIACVCLLGLETLPTKGVIAADYFVSAAGDDSRQGTFPNIAWRTITRANLQALNPGDRLLFRGGDVLEGNLVVKVAGSPSAKSPITLGSYGQGKATIRAVNGTGVAIKNIGGIVIRDLIIESKDRLTNQGSGLSILNTLSGDMRLEFVRVENIEVHGFGKDGISVGGAPADNSRSGFRDVRIMGCRASNNAYVGIHVYGKHDYYAKKYSNRDVAIINCIAHDNPGDPDFLDNHSGNGILIHDVDGGLIDGCAAFGNGGLCRAKAGGPVGIWAWSSRRLVIQNCVSVRNRTGGNYDGGGFDFDGGVSESILQYNYSAENDGAGFLVYDFGAAPFRMTGNVIRFNISENDGQKNGFAGIFVKSVGESIECLQVYHNTVFVSPPRSGGASLPAAVFVEKSKDCRFHNNLFITSGGCALVDVAKDQDGLRFQGNHYWAADGKFLICQAGKQFSSLEEWRKQHGMERLDAKDVGGDGDPLLNAFGCGEIISQADKRAGLDRYKPRAGSPLKSGLDLKALFNINSGERDFRGNLLPKDTLPTVGACATSRFQP